MEINKWADLPVDLRVALHAAQDWAGSRPDSNLEAVMAATYILAMPRAIATGVAYGSGLRGVTTQLLYITGNLGGWRGPEAQAAKKVMNDFIKENK